MVECNTCKRTFSSASRLARHKTVHHIDTQEHADWARRLETWVSLAADDLGDLRTLQSDHEDYSSPIAIPTATTTSHSGPSEKPLQCEYCPKGFTRKSALVAHVRLHTGEKPLQCEFCLKGFTRKCDLVVHVRVHTGEKPFKCEMCGRQFARNSDRQRHQRLPHARSRTPITTRFVFFRSRQSFSPHAIPTSPHMATHDCVFLKSFYFSNAKFYLLFRLETSS